MALPCPIAASEMPGVMGFGRISGGRFATRYASAANLLPSTVPKQVAHTGLSTRCCPERRMKDFSHHIGDILETITDILQPRSFEELEKYGFDQK
jgi:hypothetical protein